MSRWRRIRARDAQPGLSGEPQAKMQPHVEADPESELGGVQKAASTHLLDTMGYLGVGARNSVGQDHYAYAIAL
jgi:hypothetical protein